MAEISEQLTPRESAVLAAVERRLTNAEIAAEFFISVRTVESHIASLRRKLGVDSRTGLITASSSRRASEIQVPQNSFVGRDEDLAAVRALLDGGRWVTVVGPAGCGKTRLALELAAADGRVPVVVELANASAAEVPGVIARSIGLGADSSGNLLAACAMALQAMPCLLVVDNCDRVTDAVADAMHELLARVRSLTVLATSRSPVGGAGETVHQLLGLPNDDGPTGAVQLFLDRARSAAPAVELSAADTELVAGLCRQLDGLPLAIELAAARVRHLPLTELAAQLERGFGALERSGPTTRHSTLEAAFDWSWDLLDSDEKSVLSRLAALPATFDLELAEAVTAPGASAVVLRLLDRSLVARTTSVSEPRRFRLLVALRAFVLDRSDPGTLYEVRRAHAAFYAEVAVRLAARARTDDSRTAVEAAKSLAPEANAAIDWAIGEDDELALPLTVALAELAEQYGPDMASLAAIARAARTPIVRSAATTPQLFRIGIALCYGDLDLVAELAEIALDRAHDDLSELAARHLAGYAEAYRHNIAAALVHLDLAEPLAAGRGDLWQLASVHQGRGIALRSAEPVDPTAAMAAFRAALQSFALAGDAMHVNNTRYMMASTAAEHGLDTEQAIAWVEQCLDYARGSGNRQELAHALLVRGSLGAGPDVDADLRQAVEAFRAVGDLRCLTRSYLLQAARRPSGEQLPFLLQAVEVATAAHDVVRHALALEQLIRAEWSSGHQRQAAVALGALASLVGRDQAVARCPGPMLAELDQWEAAIAEGQARAVVGPG